MSGLFWFTFLLVVIASLTLLSRLVASLIREASAALASEDKWRPVADAFVAPLSNRCAFECRQNEADDIRLRRQSEKGSG